MTVIEVHEALVLSTRDSISGAAARSLKKEIQKQDAKKGTRFAEPYCPRVTRVAAVSHVAGYMCPDVYRDVTMSHVESKVNCPRMQSFCDGRSIRLRRRPYDSVNDDLLIKPTSVSNLAFERLGARNADEYFRRLISTKN